MIKAEIICDSINCKGNRLTTFLVEYPRMVHAEFLRHRVLSRNVASSRAMPVEKILKKIKEEPVIPVEWGKNQSGMQANSLLDNQQIKFFEYIGDGFNCFQGTEEQAAKKIWLQARDESVKLAEKMLKVGVHKQIVNRLLEPWLYCQEIITATDWGNFFNLRVSSLAQPEIRAIATEMAILYDSNKPKRLKSGEWHLPMGDRLIEGLTLEEKIKVCTARCARISYLTHLGERDYKKDLELHDSLMTNGHWSPFEHCAKALRSSKRVGNFKGWSQYRKLFQNENRKEFNFNVLPKKN